MARPFTLYRLPSSPCGLILRLEYHLLSLKGGAAEAAKPSRMNVSHQWSVRSTSLDIYYILFLSELQLVFVSNSARLVPNWAAVAPTSDFQESPKIRATILTNASERSPSTCFTVYIVSCCRPITPMYCVHPACMAADWKSSPPPEEISG